MWVLEVSVPRRKPDGPLRVLAYLLRVGREVPTMRIHYDTGLHYRTIYTAIEVLREAGFVRERYDEGPPVRRFISLTEKGMKAAKHAEEILKLAGLV